MQRARRTPSCPFADLAKTMKQEITQQKRLRMVGPLNANGRLPISDQNTNVKRRHHIERAYIALDSRLRGVVGWPLCFGSRAAWRAAFAVNGLVNARGAPTPNALSAQTLVRRRTTTKNRSSAVSVWQ